MLILDLWGISFHPAVVVGHMFNSILGHCELMEIMLVIGLKDCEALKD
jgi:hypothetical protein